MEQILVAEGQLQKCLAQVSLDVSSVEEEAEMEVLVPVTGPGAPDLSAARDAIKHALSSASDREKRVPNVHGMIYSHIF